MGEDKKKDIQPIEKAKRRNPSKKEALWENKILPELDSVGRRLVHSYIIPGLKKWADEAVHSFLYPDKSGGSTLDSRCEHTSYSNYYYDSERDRKYRRNDGYYDQSRYYSHGPLIYNFSTRARAEMVVERLKDDIRDYADHVADLQHFKQMVGENTNYVDRSFVWTADDINKIRIEPRRDGGYDLILPNPRKTVER